MSSFSLKNNLTIDNNRYLGWVNYNGNARYNLIGLNTSNNLIINPPNDLIINNGTNGTVYINNVYVRNSLYSDSTITLLKNKYIASNNSEGSANGFFGVSSSLTTSGSSRILLYGNDHDSSSGTVNIYSGKNTSSSLNFYNDTSCSLSISNNIINLNNITQFSDLTATIGNSVLFSNTTNSISSTTGSILINGGVGITGNISLNGKLLYNDTTASTNYTTGSLVLGGGLSISNTNVASDINNGGALSIAGGISIGKNALIGGNVILYNNSSTTSTSSFNANMVVYGGLGVNDTVYLRSNDSQIKIAPLTNNNPTTITFYNHNDYTGNKWIMGQSTGNFVINSDGSGTNGTILSVPNTSTGNIYFTGDIYKNGVVYAGLGTGADSSGNLTLSNLVVDTINIGISSVFSGSFNAANNVITPTAITNLIFSGSSVISFVVNTSVVIYINNVASLYETFTLSGSYSSSGWILTNYSVGDITGISFSINVSTGQIYYTSTNTPDYTSSIIRYYSTTNNVNGSYRSLSLNTSGSNAITSTIILTDTTDSVYGSSIGSLYSFGGATINKSIIGGSLTITGNSVLNGSVSTGALTSTLVSTGSIYTTGATIGTLYATTITTANIHASGTIRSTTYTGGNMQLSGVINASGITTGNLNFTGNLYQNGVAYVGSQWTTTSGNVSYTSGSVITGTVSASNVNTASATIGSLKASDVTIGNLTVTGSTITVNVTESNVVDINITTSSLNATGITAGNLNITGNLYQNNSLVTFSAFLPGFIIQYATTTSPSGWLLCDGSAVSRTTYSALFSVVGTTYGVGNGSTTFNVPDLRGRVPVGYGQGSGLTNRTMANTGGAETHTLTTTEMPSHNHGVNDPSHSHTYQTFDSIGGAIGNVNGTNSGGRYYNQNTYGAYTGISIQNAGSGGAHNNMQPYVVVNFIIKT